MRVRYRVAIALMLSLLGGVSGRAEDGTLDTIRGDVRQGMPAGTSATATFSGPRSRPEEGEVRPSNSDHECGLTEATLILAGVTVAAPFWVPYKALDDDLLRPGYFSGFPYQQEGGYIRFYTPGSEARTWAGRADVQYGTAFDQIDRVSGHLLLETTSRFGFETRAERLEEHLAPCCRDSLWLGDANLIFRFAQNEWVQFRAGLGMNWLSDEVGTDLGFNFLYGVDLFPVKPLVLSSTLDAGTLGRAPLFRIQTTVGAMVDRCEFYTGHEYADIGRTHWNALIAGVRVWF